MWPVKIVSLKLLAKCQKREGNTHLMSGEGVI